MSNIWMNCAVGSIADSFPDELRERVFCDIPATSEGRRSITIIRDSRAHNIVLFHADFIQGNGDTYLTKSAALDERQLTDFQWDAWAVEQAANGLADLRWRESSLYHTDLIEPVELLPSNEGICE